MSMSSRPNTGVAAPLLRKQFEDIQTSKILPGISCGLSGGDNLLDWEVMFMINDDCKYYGGGSFRARLRFPEAYPHEPPSLTFSHPIPFHPNIYEDGRLCISILHPPEEDLFGYESAAERWSPVQSPETILVSCMSLFYDPNVDSPANVEASRMMRDELLGFSKDFRKRCRQIVRQSLGEE